MREREQVFSKFLHNKCVCIHERERPSKFWRILHEIKQHTPNNDQHTPALSNPQTDYAPSLSCCRVCPLARLNRSPISVPCSILSKPASGRAACWAPRSISVPLLLSTLSSPKLCSRRPIRYRSSRIELCTLVNQMWNLLTQKPIRPTRRHPSQANR